MLKSQSEYKSNAGFTLLEILVVIGILSIITAIALPGITSWRQNADMNADLRRLYGFFQKARLEAVTKSQICSITFGQTDENGVTFDYFSFADANADNIYASADDTVVFAGNLTPGVTMLSNNFPLNADGLRTATFNTRGLIGGNGGGVIMGATIVMQSSTGLTHDLVFNRHGRMRIE